MFLCLCVSDLSMLNVKQSSVCLWFVMSAESDNVPLSQCRLFCPNDRLKALIRGLIRKYTANLKSHTVKRRITESGSGLSRQLIDEFKSAFLDDSVKVDVLFLWQCWITEIPQKLTANFLHNHTKRWTACVCEESCIADLLPQTTNLYWLIYVWSSDIYQSVKMTCCGFMSCYMWDYVLTECRQLAPTALRALFYLFHVWPFVKMFCANIKVNDNR